MIATTRGWLSPGTHAPLVATGGTGNDEFVVYSNQAELRLEGHDDNDLFIVRAFALAAVCDTSADNDDDCDFADIDLEADPDTLRFPVDTAGPGGVGAPDGVCDATENPGYDGEGWTGFRKDNNGDGTCNKADAHMTGAETQTSPADIAQWEDDVIPLDDDGVARPIIGLGFSTARPLDIRAGGGEDEVSYNVNAPVSVDGGTGFDKLVILGTEFADDIVITSKAIYGAGLNVRYTTIEVVEVDGLEGDDEFFVQSTAFGVAYRVIGGLGSDTINVTGDVVEDIVTRELEGVSGTIDHLVTSVGPNGDVLYHGLPVDGLEYNLATPDAGQVIIGDEGTEGTSVREGGSPFGVPQRDWYSVMLAGTPTANVYVTASAARSTQVEFDDVFSNPEPTDSSESLADGDGDSIWVCTSDQAGDAPGNTDCSTLAHFQRAKTINGQLFYENGRAVVLTFTPGDWNVKQWVYVWAVDDPRSEGDVVVVVQHSTISADDNFDGVAVRNVEVSVRDNDTPGVYVTEVTPGTDDEDGRTLVIEGGYFDPLIDTSPHKDPIAGHNDAIDTRLTDELLVALQKDPGAALIRVKITMNAATQQEIQLESDDPLWGGTNRFNRWAHVDANPLLSFTYYTIDFDTTNWFIPVVLRVLARSDADPEDPFTAVIRFSRDDSAVVDLVDDPDVPGDERDIDLGQTVDPDETYVFPNIRSGNGLIAAAVIDDETADVIAIESGRDTVVQLCGDDLCSIPGQTDTYTIRLTKRPEVLDDDDHSVTPVAVDVAILTDGMVDVISIGGVGVTPGDYVAIGGDVSSQRFTGNITVTATTITRANGSELGSFVEEGFQVGDRITTSFNGGTVFTVTAVTDDVLTVSGGGLAAGGYSGAAISTLTRKGIWDGHGSFVAPVAPDLLNPFGQGWKLVRADGGQFPRRRLPRGPVGRGLRVQRGRHLRRHQRALQDPGHPRDEQDVRREARVPLRRRRLPRRPQHLRRRAAHARGHPHRRGRPLRRLQLVRRAGDRARGRRQLPGADHPRRRQGLPGVDARAVEAAGPTGRRRRRVRRRPLAQPRPQAAGRDRRPAVQDRHPAARDQADRRPQHLQRRLEGEPHRDDDVDDAVRPRPAR